MSDPSGNTPQNNPRPFGQTLFLGGLCILLGAISFLIGVRVIPSGKVEPSAFNSLLGAGAGLLFIFAGIMVFIRDLAGAKDNEDIPQNAPLALRIGEKLLTIVILALFASVSTLIAFGPFFYGSAEMEQQMGSFGAGIFRFFNGVMSFVLWYAVIYLTISRVKKIAGKQ